ncbi:hypothetical protein PSTG_18984, partial [Puccinia striiformis f. sp. tritici PST-78]
MVGSMIVVGPEAIFGMVESMTSLASGMGSEDLELPSAGGWLSDKLGMTLLSKPEFPEASLGT